MFFTQSLEQLPANAAMEARTNDELVAQLVDSRTLRSLQLIHAFKSVDRKYFVPSELHTQAYADYPLPIGLGQTISQPSTVAFMLQLLQPLPGQRILEVGAGSGYVAALLAYVVGGKGKVVALERLAQLAALAKRNLKSFLLPQLMYVTADGSQGYPRSAPYDRILVSAAADELPSALLEQLTEQGRLVAPVGSGYQDIVLVERTPQGFKQKRYPGFAFVPLIPGGE